MIGNNPSQMIIQEPTPVFRVFRLGPVGEQDGNRAQYHDIHVMRIHIAKNRVWIPAVLVDIAEEQTIIAHHPRLARRVMVELDKPSIPVSVLQRRPPFWKDMGVTINLDHAETFTGACITVPHFEHVQCSALP
jgi:hypothetical protein